MDMFMFLWGNVDIRNPEFRSEPKAVDPEDDDNGSEDECF